MSTRIKKKKINDYEVKAVPMNRKQPNKIKGEKLGLGLYHNTAIIAPKNSGKSHLIYRILKETTNKDTEIIIICPTHEKDPLYLKLINDFEARGNSVRCFYEIDEILDDIMNEPLILSDEESDEENETEAVYPSQSQHVNFISTDFDEFDQVPDAILNRVESTSLSDGKKKSRKKKKKKKIKTAPKKVIVFDDLSQGCRNPMLDLWLKRHRHSLTSNIISVQYFCDISPSSARQIDNFIAFPGLTDKKLKELHRHSDTRLSYNDFKNIYEDATNKKYNFLFINTRNDSFKKNFNKQYILN